MTNGISGQHLRGLAVELEVRSRQLILAGGLGFVNPPATNAPIPELPSMDPNDLQLHRLSLRPDEPANIPVLEYERWLLVARKEVLPHAAGDDTLAENLSVNLEEAFRILQLHKVGEWERQREDVHLREGLKALSDSLARPEACTSFETGTYMGFHRWITTQTLSSRFFWWASPRHRTFNTHMLRSHGGAPFDVWTFPGRLHVPPPVHRADSSDEFRAYRHHGTSAQWVSKRSTYGVERPGA